MEYGLIGGKLGHSYSRLIHEQVGGYAYELRPLPTEEAARAFFQARAFRAVNVTIPYKKLALACCDVVDPAAAAIGAVNTVVNKNGTLYGYNTDYAGFRWLARKHDVRLTGKTVLILGTGGTSATVSAVCRDAGAARIYTVSRSGRDGALTYEQAAAHREAEILINTTPAGMYPDVGNCLVDLANYPRLEAALDVVYNPFRTELLLRAEELGLPGYCGFEMLVAQAVYAAEYFTGKTMDKDLLIETTHRGLKRQLTNISLIGMPGCGKSSIGEALAAELGKTYIDLDEVVELRAGMPIPDIFERQGEAAFRRFEAEAVAEVSRESGQVIACGGGVIKTPGNTRHLRMNGPVIWIRRPVEFLAMSGRPLSTGRDALRRMQVEREPAYRAAADAAVDNTGSLKDTVSAVRAAFEQVFDYAY